MYMIRAAHRQGCMNTPFTACIHTDAHAHRRPHHHTHGPHSAVHSVPSNHTAQPWVGACFLPDLRPRSPPTIVLSAVASSGSCRAVTPMTTWPCASSRTRQPLRSTWSSWWAVCRLSQQWWAQLCRSSTRCPPALAPQLTEQSIAPGAPCSPSVGDIVGQGCGWPGRRGSACACACACMCMCSCAVVQLAREKGRCVRVHVQWGRSVASRGGDRHPCAPCCPSPPHLWLC